MKNTLKKEKKIIPTYIPRKAMDLPMFFEKKPYQGASGRLYPLPFSDSISDEKTDVEYDVYTLENNYLSVWVLPQMGGKVLRAYDKIGNYDFVYYNEVIKPALVGLAGPWISGGIEFNYPQHHRPTTYMPLEAVTEQNENEATVWTGEVEPFNRMKGMAGITIDEGRSYFKAKVKVYNSTSQNQVFMWWANLAVPVNENYKTIFPPDVEWVNDHDRRCVIIWPVAKGVYHTARPFNYGEGTDISLYSAVKVPSSFLVSQGQSDMDFVAGYDKGKDMGIVTVADHHISPGKKMWHWGKGDFGDMWCSNLTDKNGPSIELMTGVYTDNQPDFTWLAPYESRTFEQYWYPIHGIGDVKNATIDAAVNVEERDAKLFFGFNVTGTFENAKVMCIYKDRVMFEDTASLTPADVYTKEIDMAEMDIKDIKVCLYSKEGKLLVSYKTYIRGNKEPITPRQPVLRPCEMKTVEELYLNGLHLEQYKQHNYDPRDYYLEGIKREPYDSRCNTGLARICYKNGDFEGCISYADSAINSLTARNMHPTDTEALYLKGLALKELSRLDEAYDAFGRAGWDYKYRSASYFEASLIDSIKHDYAPALEKLDVSVSYNAGHTKALCTKALILQKSGQMEESKKVLEEVQKYDKLDMLCAFLLLDFGESKEEFISVFGKKPENFVDVAYDCIRAGFYEKAIEVLELAPMEYPLFDYIKGYCYTKLGDCASSLKCIKKAEKLDTGYCFPSRIYDICVLENAITLNPDGDNAYYYLGCLFYDKFAYEKATALWEKCVSLNSKHPKAFRNLALSYFDKKKDFLSAKKCLETALENKKDDPRILFEYQQLLKNMNYSPEHRLAVYEKYKELELMRDDCILDEITLHSLVGDYEKAISIAAAKRFHIYEGGEGKLTKQHAWMHVLYGNRLAMEGQLDKAVEIYTKGINMPKSYGEAKTFFNQEAHIYYYMGLVTEALGKDGRECFENAAVYKAAVSEISLFRALALRKLCRFTEAREVLEEMLACSDNFINNSDRRTYYGVGSPSPMPFELDIVKNNLTEGYILRAYALLGLGRFDEAQSFISKVKELSPYDFRVHAFDLIKDSLKN